MPALSWSILVSKIRRLVVPVALAWLLIHVFVTAGTVALLFAGSASEADLICACGHGADHGSCPMHRKPADSARCRLQSTQNDLGLALLSMLGPLTLPVATLDIVAVISSPAAKGYDATLPLDWTSPPDAPPPRS
jgi:hypothetical protein